MAHLDDKTIRSETMKVSFSFVVVTGSIYHIFCAKCINIDAHKLFQLVMFYLGEYFTSRHDSLIWHHTFRSCVISGSISKKVVVLVWYCIRVDKS